MKTKRRWLFIIFLLCGLCSNADVIWPDDQDWISLKDANGIPIVDLEKDNGIGNDEMDIYGDDLHPSAYYKYDNGSVSNRSDDNLMFRLRVRGFPKKIDKASGVWAFMFDFDNDQNIDWVLQLDKATHNQVEFLPTITGGQNLRGIELDHDAIHKSSSFLKTAHLFGALFFYSTAFKYSTKGIGFLLHFADQRNLLRGCK